MAEQFVKLGYGLNDNKIWQALSRPARDLFIQIKASRNRKKNGKIINTNDDQIEFGFSDSWGMDIKTYLRAIEELRINGFIQLIEPGQFPRKKSVYALINKWRTYEKARQQGD